MAVRNAFHAQSGGGTAVINATACGLIQEARRHPGRIGRFLAGRGCIVGTPTACRQRSARHLTSRFEQAHAPGVAAVDRAPQGKNAVMPTAGRLANVPCRREIGDAPLADVANAESRMPSGFSSGDGFHITDVGRTGLQPLIAGEDPPSFRKGLPDYVRPDNVTVARKLGLFSI